MVANSTASVPIVVSGGITVADLNVALNITHTWIGDMIITLSGPVTGTSTVNNLQDVTIATTIDPEDPTFKAAVLQAMPKIYNHSNIQLFPPL